jgi:hypothetical protein
MTLQSKTPLWAAWNANYCFYSLPTQRIAYIANITLPPTRLDVVVETLQRSLVAEECGLPCIPVTFDLAIAKPAQQIQAIETPKYDILFICFGAFHTICF